MSHAQENVVRRSVGVYDRATSKAIENDLPAGDALSRVCPLCAASADSPWLRKADLRLVRCSRCQMVYANPAPREMASGTYYDEQGQSFYLSAAKLEADYAPVRFERELRFFRRHCHSGKVLDVGCSSGAFLYHLKTSSADAYEVLGTDVSGAPLDYAESRGVPVIRGDFLALGQPAVFDAITFWAVIEHLLEPRQFLVHARELLREPGLCFVLVPNLRSLATRVLGAKYRYVYAQHLNYFTAETLKRMGVEAGFELVSMQSTHFNPIVLWQDLSRPKADVSNAERAQLLQRTTRWKRSPALRILRLAYRGCEAALGTFRLADNLMAVFRRR